MKKFSSTRLVSLILAIVMLMGMVSINVFAEGTSAQAEPTVDIIARNVWYGETYYPMFAVDKANAPEGAEVSVIITRNGEATSAVEVEEGAVIGDVTYPAFRAGKGVAASEIDTLYTAQAVLKVGDEVVAESPVYTYSILQYVYEILYVAGDGYTEVKDVCEKFLAFAQAAETYHAGTTELTDKAFVYVNNGTVDGTNKGGIYDADEILADMTCTLTPEDNKILYWGGSSYVGNAGTPLEETSDADFVGHTVKASEIIVYDPVYREEVVNAVTVSKTVAALITEYGWTSSTTKQSFTLDNVVSVQINGGSNTGKAYGGDHIRIYATDSPAGTVTISVAEGYELVSIKISTHTGTYAFLQVDGTTTDISNVSTAVSGTSVKLNSVKNGSDGKQVRITGFEVVYKVAD